ncbi:hypothetical protein IG193_01915 [Infirmifilum lucidum]|uniref:Uncharacterized protein n=1 Tax=Infirmifilum lucidum TaxID=2776706 RepID=A0A7L9FJQ1_9CREN|nr:hypothetical protein [Infirmifilum lucidum]QOJ79243.1 hypothetical protein IG193_01915 [Infirmifilum lucidum]
MPNPPNESAEPHFNTPVLRDYSLINPLLIVAPLPSLLPTVEIPRTPVFSGKVF